MAVVGLLLFVLRHVLASIFSADPSVVEIAESLLVIAALFQLIDGIQVTVIGALRGMEDVKIPMLVAYGSYWGVAIPLGFVLGFVWKLNAPGIWIGLASGILVVALANSCRFWKLSR